MAANLSEQALYDKLSRHVMNVQELEAHDYPTRDPEFNELMKIPLDEDGRKLTLREKLASNDGCFRCQKPYRVDEDDISLDGCFVHHGEMVWNEYLNKSTWFCCGKPVSDDECQRCLEIYSVDEDGELHDYRGFVATQAKQEREPNKHGIYALDCEMCHTTHGKELIKVAVINHKQDMVYEKLVKPSNPILDYNTKFSGIKEGDLENVETTLADVQRDLLELFSSRTILIGHSLDSDMKALKIFHGKFIDTAQLFPHPCGNGPPSKRSLASLMKYHFDVEIKQGGADDCKENALAALRLVMHKVKIDVRAK